MRKPILFDKSSTPHAWGFIYNNCKCSDVDILDAIEDATNETELKDNINSLNGVYYHFNIDRVTDTYVRLKAQDTLGNVYYIRAEF